MGFRVGIESETVARLYVEIAPNCYWDASEDSGLITISPSSGYGSTEIVITRTDDVPPFSEVTLTVGGYQLTLTDTPPPSNHQPFSIGGLIGVLVGWVIPFITCDNPNNWFCKFVIKVVVVAAPPAGGGSSPGSNQLPPRVDILEANVAADRIRVRISGPAGQGARSLQLVVDGLLVEPFTIVTDLKDNGEHDYRFPFEQIPDGLYTSITASLQGAASQSSKAINLFAPICSGGENDDRTSVVRDYVLTGVGWRPECNDLTQTLPSSSAYSIGASRQPNTWNASNSGNWALLDPAIVSKVECILQNYAGADPQLTSGYRTPSDQVRIQLAQGGDWPTLRNAPHVFGMAADLDTPNGDAGQDELGRVGSRCCCLRRRLCGAKDNKPSPFSCRHSHGNRHARQRMSAHMETPMMNMILMFLLTAGTSWQPSPESITVGLSSTSWDARRAAIEQLNQLAEADSTVMESDQIATLVAQLISQEAIAFELRTVSGSPALPGQEKMFLETLPSLAIGFLGRPQPLPEGFVTTVAMSIPHVAFSEFTKLVAKQGARATGGAVSLTLDNRSFVRNNGYSLIGEILKANDLQQVLIAITPEQRTELLSRLQAGLLDSSASCRGNAIRAIVLARDLSSVPMLTYLSVNDPDAGAGLPATFPSVRRLAAEALAKLSP